ncbi:endoribonuclease MazF [Luteolibacter arcticus]|uniref:Endoribonuclease MazF n=1 Tax=Luteolibacter arcticus TaxID=1581411 RepID=A0ABT3GJQ3_9BACT|nr:endoribonuclease MazF [Luteolibacter arcticus]MCW1923706.1 endoribonuclease MazF [Luteolibacter arcticus]
MKKAAYIPERGDVVWTDFDPQAGREQAGKRPALVLSPQTYNAKTGLAVMVPITSHVKGYPFEVAIQGKSIQGVALSDHLKNLDWNARGVRFVEAVPNDVLDEINRKIATLLSI